MEDGGSNEGESAEVGKRWRGSGKSEHFLHVDDVQPAVEFEAYFFEEGYLIEAVGGVDGYAGGLFGVDAGDDRVMAQGAGAVDQVGEEGAADALALVVGVDVDGVFDGARVGGAGVEA